MNADIRDPHDPQAGIERGDPASAQRALEAVEFLANNCELRSFFQFFRIRTDCAGIMWRIEDGATVAANQVIGEFAFAGGAPVAIIAPIDGTVVRTFNPNPSDLSRRPSATIALFKATS